mgnify:CR=1 FL=1
MNMLEKQLDEDWNEREQVIKNKIVNKFDDLIEKLKAQLKTTKQELSDNEDILVEMERNLNESEADIEDQNRTISMIDLYARRGEIGNIKSVINDLRSNKNKGE